MVAFDAEKKIETVHARHGAVEKHEIESVRLRVEHRPCLDTVAREFGGEAFAAQMGIEQRSIELVVFDDQYIRLLRHRGM